jgi:hypothetical protein
MFSYYFREKSHDGSLVITPHVCESRYTAYLSSSMLRERSAISIKPTGVDAEKKSNASWMFSGCFFALP